MIMNIRINHASRPFFASLCQQAGDRAVVAGLVTALLAIPTALALAQTAPASPAADAEQGLQFWAVNEGGARIYRPDVTACMRIRGLSAQYADAISTRYQVPAYTLKIAAVLVPKDGGACVLRIDTPAGLHECRLGSVMRTFGGSYLAHTYAQRDDGSVYYVTAACQ